MRGREAIALVARRELRERIREKSFLISTAINIVIIVAVIVIPYKLGGWDEIFGAAEAKFKASPNPGDGVILGGPAQLQYATLAFGSAPTGTTFALMAMYPSSASRPRMKL